CEYLKDPLGIDTFKPRLSWVLEAKQPEVRGLHQSAWQIIAASSRKKLEANRGDYWDSGKVQSDQPIEVEYGGKRLKSEEECFWKVRVWDQESRCSEWSEVGKWSMGLLSPSDWQAKWIGLDGIDPRTTLTGTSWIWFPEWDPVKVAPI